MEILNTVIALLGLLATVILSLALPKSLGRSPKSFFGICITQNTISKNKMPRKMTAPIVFQTPAVMFLKM